MLSDINAELAARGGERFELTRELREQVRFARPVSGGRNGWPVMRSGNKSPEQLTITVDPEAAGMPTWPRSSWHTNRSHWPEPWRLAEYGITAMGRTFWMADHPDIRPDDHAWRLAVDLDKSEVCISGHWQRMEFTTEARRHGEGTEGRVSGSTENATIGLVAEFNASLSHPETSCLKPSVSPCLSGSTWPEPHDGMTEDERRGHRRVKNERGDIVWRCGPGPGETLAEFTAWRHRLNEYFEQKTSKETKGAA